MATSWSPRTTYRIRQLPGHLQDRHQAIALLIRLEESLGPLDNIFMSPLASSANLWERIPSKTTTVRFKRLPTVLANTKNQWILLARDAGYAQNVVIDIHFLEFTVFNDVAPETHICDCIAISGLSGHAFGSWRCKDYDSDFMWLRDGLPHDVPVMRSMTYGYDTSLLMSTSVQTIEDIARMFIRKLKSEGRSSPSTKPLMFLAHSLGGIILKRALVILANSGSAENFILKSVRAVVFFGVPSHGMYVSHLLSMVEGQPNETLVKFLAPGSAYLANLDEQFYGIASLQHIRVISVYETGLSRTAENIGGEWKRSGPLELLVTPESAISRVSIEADQLPINEDHSNMVKFSEDDINYRGVVLYLLDISRNLENNSDLGDPPSPNLAISATSMKELTETSGTQREMDIGKLRLNKQLLQSLEVEESHCRLEEIAEHYHDTFGWIYSDKNIGFTKWLLYGSGIFWINGKPGSGKSTLMKYIVKSEITNDILRQRNYHGNQITVAFFFHNRGTHLQKSLEGLYRDILHQIFRKLPQLQAIALPKYGKMRNVRKKTWDLNELEELFQAVLQQSYIPVSITLFLDALDEYDGPAERIARFIKTSLLKATSSVTKFQICFSSRPWNHFVDEFGDFPGFKIHERTKDDIRSYISGRLGENLVTRRLGIATRFFDSGSKLTVTEEIVERAQGVFLWVRLTIDEITQAATDGASVSDLFKMLSDLPDELENLYIRTIDRISTRRDIRLESYAIFEIVLRYNGDISLVDLAAAVACSTCATVSECAAKIPSGSETSEFEDQFSRRLKHRCGGLVEVIDGTAPCIVQFMHQTVKDFVNNPEFQAYIIGREEPPLVENGFSFLSKYTLTCLATGRKYFRNVGGKLVLPVTHLSLIFAFLSESTTGMSQRRFLDSVADVTFRTEYTMFFIPAANRLNTDRLVLNELPINSRLSFAVVANLRLYVKESLTERSLVHMNPEKSLLHCAVEAPIYIGLRLISVTKRDRSDMIRILLERGADMDAKFNNLTPFQMLFCNFTKDCPEDWEESVEFLGMVQVFLNQGQKPDCIIDVASEPGEGNFRCTPLHVARRELCQMLISHGANVNALDEDNRTALDVSYIVWPGHNDEYELMHEEMYERTMILIADGGRVTSAIDQRALNNSYLEDFLEAMGGYYAIDPRMKFPKRIGES